MPTTTIETEDGPITLDDSERTPCEVYTRVMGYHRPVSAFNAGKQAEHRERKLFSEHSQGAQALMNGQSRPEPEPQPIPEPTVKVAVDPPASCRYQRVDALAAAA